jgi:hypothetical protein
MDELVALGSLGIESLVTIQKDVISATGELTARI